jgi:hypothetical protein
MRARLVLVYLFACILGSLNIACSRTRGPQIRVDQPFRIDDLQARLDTPKYDSFDCATMASINIGTIEGLLFTVALTNPGEDWKAATVPLSEVRVVASDGKSYEPRFVDGSGLNQVICTCMKLQGVTSAKVGFVGETGPSNAPVHSFAGMSWSFSPPGKDPTVDPHTAKISSVKGVWKMEIAAKQSFRLGLLFDIPRDAKPVSMTWPKVGTVTF